MKTLFDLSKTVKLDNKSFSRIENEILKYDLFSSSG
ncbi:MAG: hypothetical protein Ct9H90mP3_6170 [Flammeovirgaceae bacterium]|nr:MAG: hypothetical protein Ct9H90mP3_6170 [Flammeovirgaceae bacterium]